MRCRKVRSLLSAACSDELAAGRHAAVREHLAECPACRKEAAYHTSIRQATAEMPRPQLSEDFNTRLLNRIAEQRFEETRTKAYLPHKAPRFAWRWLTPVAVTTALLAVVVVGLYSPDRPGSMSPSMATAPAPIDDSYLTAQPSANPNLTIDLHDDWTLAHQLERAERLEEVSRRLTNQNGFGNMYLTGSRSTYQPNRTVIVGGGLTADGSRTFRVYQVSGGSVTGEASQAY